MIYGTSRTRLAGMPVFSSIQFRTDLILKIGNRWRLLVLVQRRYVFMCKVSGAYSTLRNFTMQSMCFMLLEKRVAKRAEKMSSWLEKDINRLRGNP